VLDSPAVLFLFICFSEQKAVALLAEAEKRGEGSFKAYVSFL